MQNFSEKKKTKQTENQCFKYCGDGPSCSEDNLEEFFKNHSGKDGMFCVAVQIQENVSQIAMETPSLMMLCQALQRVLYDEDVASHLCMAFAELRTLFLLLQEQGLSLYSSVFSAADTVC